MITPMRRTVPIAAAGAALLLAGACSRDGNASGAPPSDAPRPAASADGLSVRGVGGYYDLGDYFVMGEVVNQTGAPVHDVELDVVYTGAGGERLAADGAAVVLTRVEPGDRAPFVHTHYGAPQGITGPRVAVRGFSAARSAYHPLTIVSAAARPGITGAVVEGRVRNDSGRPLAGVKLVAWFRDAAGTVTGVHFDYPLIGTMDPGREVDFTIETMDDAVEDDEVTVRGEGTAGG